MEIPVEIDHPIPEQIDHPRSLSINIQLQPIEYERHFIQNSWFSHDICKLKFIVR
jgi:hypothetical protein